MTHVAQAGRVGYGLLLFLALSLGLGLPLTVLAFFSGSISRLPGAGDWMVWVRSFFGVILALMAVYMARPLLGDQLFLWLLVLTGAAGGVYLGFIEKSGRGRFRIFKRAAGLVIIGLAGLCLWWFQPPAPNATGEHIQWRPVTQKALQEARAAGKPAVVFFTADWCPPCRQLKAVSLPDPRVIKAFEPFAHLKADLTTGGSPEVKRLTQRWRVRGVPTMVFLDGGGRAMPELTVVGFIPASDLAERLKTVLERSRAVGAGKGG
jgi:thiol:disulfide interchange protein DsbD